MTTIFWMFEFFFNLIEQAILSYAVLVQNTWLKHEIVNNRCLSGLCVANFELQLTFAISNTCYFERLLSWTFSFVSSALSVTALLDSFSILNSAISSFHFVQQFFWSPQPFLRLFSIRYLEHLHFTHSNVEKYIRKF